MKKLVLFLFLVSCQSSPPIKSYKITTFQESGEVSEVFEVKKVDFGEGSATFDWGGQSKTVTGSYKLEAIY